MLSLRDVRVVTARRDCSWTVDCRSCRTGISADCACDHYAHSGRRPSLITKPTNHIFNTDCYEIILICHVLHRRAWSMAPLQTISKQFLDGQSTLTFKTRRRPTFYSTFLRSQTSSPKLSHPEVQSLFTAHKDCHAVSPSALHILFAVPLA